MEYLVLGPASMGIFTMLGALINIEDDLKNIEKIAKAWDCEAQEYRMKYHKASKIEEKDYEHIGDCVREVPEEYENIFENKISQPLARTLGEILKLRREE